MSILDKVISWPSTHVGQQCVYPVPENKPCYMLWQVDHPCDLDLNKVYFFDPYFLNGLWEDPRNWWIDSNHTIPYLVVPPSGSSVVVDSPLLASSGPIPTVSNIVFNASNAIAINVESGGFAEFKVAGTTNTGIINGNVKVTYPAQGPIGGTITGDIQYINFPTPPAAPFRFLTANKNGNSQILDAGESWDMDVRSNDECGIVYFYFTNNSGRDLGYRIDGFVNDDIEINGVIYEDGQYPFWVPPEFPTPPCGRINGAHSFGYPKARKEYLPNGGVVLVRALDNGGGSDWHGSDLTLKASFITIL